MPSVRPDSIPEALQSRAQWLHWDASADTPRRPHRQGDFAVAWSDPDEWLSFDAALDAAMNNESWGLGYVTAAENDRHPTGVISVLDLDGAAQLTADGPVLADWVPDLDPFVEQGAYIEWSPSRREGGDRCGLHIPLVGTDIPEWFSDTHRGDHVGIDLLANKFCTVTGDRHERSGDELAQWTDAVEQWLADAVENLTGDRPDIGDGQDTLPTSGRERERDDDWPDEEAAEELLNHVDPGCSYPTWRNIGFALADHFPEPRARRLFVRWSRGSSKWDDDAQDLAEDIVGRGGGGVTIGTLVHHAKQGGWEPDHDDQQDRTPTPRELVARASDEFETVEDVPDDVFERDEEEESADTESAEEAGDDGESGDDNDTWEMIRLALAEAENADERRAPRFEAAMELHESFHFANLEENETLWCYDPEEGIYRQNGTQVIRQTLTEGLQEQYRGQTLSVVDDHIRGRNTIPQDEMGGPDGKIAAQNCVIDLIGETTEPHSPEHMFTSRLGAEFDADADCPQWRAFLDQVVSNDTDRQKLQEFVGYCLHHWSMPYHKALFLVGPTASGKSTFLDTVNELLGEGTVASLTPQQLTTERFAPAEIFGKWANIRNDIPKATVENTGTLKEVLAGDPLKAEEKRKDPFFFEPRAKHLFSANQLPEMEVDDEAFFRRILLVPFPETIPKSERDKHLADKLEDELPGILNWAIEGLQRLLANGSFTGDRSPGQTRETWSKWGDSVERFAAVALEEGAGELPKGDVYQAYLQFCRDEGMPSDTQHSMTRELKREGFADGRAYVGGERQRVFTGVSWTSRGEELLERAQSTGDGGGKQFGGLSDFE